MQRCGESSDSAWFQRVNCFGFQTRNLEAASHLSRAALVAEDRIFTASSRRTQNQMLPYELF